MGERKQDRVKYSDDDIFTIIKFPCQCHPYCGSRCDKCVKLDHLLHNQVDDLRRLYKAGKIRISTDSLCTLEVSE